MSRQQNRDFIKQNKLMSAFYDYVGEHHIDNICADIDRLKVEIEKVEVPESLDDWFNQYIKNVKKQEKKKSMARKARKTSSRVAAILLILFVSLITLTLSVEAFRIQVYNLFFTDHEEYSSIRIKQGSTGDVDIEWESYYYPTYIPEGFYVESTMDNAKMRVINYKNQKNEYIIFIQVPNGVNLDIDTEDGINKEMIVNSNKAIFVKKEGKNILFWNNDEISFYLTSDLDIQKLILIAESLEKK